MRWGWVVTNVASPARLATRKRPPRQSMTGEEVRAVLAASADVGRPAELALRLAAVTGARRSEIASLRWDDLTGDHLRIDSSVAVVRKGPRAAPREPDLVDDTTKTANRRVVTVDDGTVAMWDALRSSYADPGEWVFGLSEPANPDRIG